MKTTSTKEISKFVTTLAGIQMPRMIYGTAWKKDKTADLVKLALESGFVGFDTACQPKHYYEPGTGKAVSDYLALNKNVKRSDIFIQTKFTFIGGQDPNNIPYNSKASFPDQVEESIKKSFVNLNTDYIDSYVLHGPWSNNELTEADWKAWNTMTALYKKGLVKQLGISNVNTTQLHLL